MGYQAPSPEEVYRYALRLDGGRSLTDRFGFSIVFVNDTSPVCREFLNKHCVDLCLRTADRIRFIFFSELPLREFEDIAHDLQTGRGHGSMLRSVLGLLGFERRAEFEDIAHDLQTGRSHRSMFRSVLDLLGFKRRAEFERDPWRFLRPRALRPLRTVDEISERLSWECDRHTAMPGAGMAMQFAQRLGIGRYVPCILVFTEVGDLHVDLLPIAGLTVDLIYRHVRTWIDEFYEQNRAVIDKWERVEREITTLINQANSSLSEVRNWRDARAREWETLSQIAEVIYAAEHGDLMQFEALADPLQHSFAMGEGGRDLLRGKIRAIRNVAAAKRSATELRRLAADLAATEGPVGVLASLKTAYARARAIGEQLSRAPHYISALAQRLEHPQTPLGFVELWWRTANRQKLSLKLFKSERTGWEHTLRLPHAVNFRQEFEVIRKGVEDLPLCGDVVTGSVSVLRAYGEHIGFDVGSEAWQRETEHYRTIVQHFLHRICSTAPEWLRERRPSLTIGETFPRPQELDGCSTDQMLLARTALRAAIEEATISAPDAVREDIGKTNALAVAHRDEVHAELEAKAERLDVPDDWSSRFLGDVLAELRPVRRRLELATFSATNDLPRASEWNAELATRLHRALDIYADVARSFRYPHRDDPLLRRVPIDVPLPVAAGIRAQRDAREIALRSSLDGAAVAAASLPRVRTEASAAAVEAQPTARLARALRAAVPENRLTAVLRPFHADTLEARVDVVVSQGRAADILRSFTPAEQDAIARMLAESSKEKPKAEHPVDATLMTLGLYTATTAKVALDDAALVLQEKVLADDFDVFMAHNSHDKPAILEVGRRLRSAGVYPWIDVEQIAPGRWFQDVIQAVIPRVRAAAIFIGSAGLGRWQALELRTFITACVERGLPVIPVLLPGASGIPPEAVFLRELNFVQFVGGLDDEHALGRLFWGITGEKPAIVSGPGV